MFRPLKALREFTEESRQVDCGSIELERVREPVVIPHVGRGLLPSLDENVFLPEEDARVVEGQNALHGYAAAGVRSNPGDLTAQFGLAYLFPTSGDPTYWGPVALASINPAGAGGGLRVAGGFGAGLAWLTVGAIKLNDRGTSAIVNLDITTDFICDLVSFC